MLTNTEKMKRILLLVSLLCAAVAGAQTATPEQLARRLRVVTYNVRNGMGMDGRTDLDRVAEAIVRSGADVVAVQEIDSVTHRSGGRYVLGELASRVLMHASFAPAIAYDGGKYGIGLLSKRRPAGVKRIPLPGREEERVLMVADFGDYRVANAHLSLTEADALASVETIAREAASDPRPFIVTGDWNSRPDSPVIEAMKRAGFEIVSGEKTATWPADNPRECIDYVAVFKPASCGAVRLSARVLDEPAASDHRPVRADLQFKMPAGAILYHAPYLQNPFDGGVTVMFQTNVLAHCRVEYGRDTLALQTAEARMAGQAICHDIEHKIRLDGLTAGVRYYYRVRAREIIANHAYSKTFGDEYVSPFYSFTLPAADATDFTALIFNDLHEHTPTIEAWRRLSAEIPHDFVIFNGDCLPEPSDRRYAMRHTHILADAFGGESTPLFFIRGNHEIRNAYSSGMPSLFELPGGRTYGAFNWGDTRFVVLDCGEDKPDDTWVYYGLNDFTDLRREQAQFLRDELTSKPFRKARRRVLVHHIPVWGNTDEYRPCTGLWHPILVGAPFDVDLAGHTHEHKYHPRGTCDDNPVPVVIGGGPGLREATMMVLEKRGKKLTLRVLDTRGEEIRCISL